MQQSTNEQISSIEYDFCRKLTSIDVDQALYSLKINQNSLDNSQKYLEDFELKQCDCCQLLRRHSLLPLARRGRPHISTRSHRLLCSNCSQKKRQQQIDILKNQSNQIFVWKSNSSNDNYSLTDNEKKLLLEETIKKLQIILNNHPTINNQDNFEFTYRTLQTTINILSSSHNSIENLF